MYNPVNSGHKYLIPGTQPSEIHGRAMLPLLHHSTPYPLGDGFSAAHSRAPGVQSPPRPQPGRGSQQHVTTLRAAFPAATGTGLGAAPSAGRRSKAASAPQDAQTARHLQATRAPRRAQAPRCRPAPSPRHWRPPSGPAPPSPDAPHARPRQRDPVTCMLRLPPGPAQPPTHRAPPQGPPIG